MRGRHPQALQNRVTVCISDVDKWMASNRLQRQNGSASNRQQHLIPSDPFSVYGDTVKPAKSIRDLGIFLQ